MSATMTAPATATKTAKIDVPQAEILERVGHVAVLVSEGTNTTDSIAEFYGMVGRMGNYYANATIHLGLIGFTREGHKRVFHLTDTGKSFVAADQAGKVEILRRVVMNSYWVKFYTDHGKSTNALVNHMREVGNIGQFISDRRALDTVIRWHRDAQAMKSTTNLEARAMPEGRGTMQVTAKAGTVRRNVVNTLCGTCFMEVPLSGQCGNCD